MDPKIPMWVFRFQCEFSNNSVNPGILVWNGIVTWVAEFHCENWISVRILRFKYGSWDSSEDLGN